MTQVLNSPLFEEHELPIRHFTESARREWQGAIRSIYERMNARAATGPYKMQCGNLDLIVLPGVYAPRFFTDSLWFAHHLSRIVGEQSLLEIGTGTGMVAISCACKGARVVATDVNPIAVRNAMLNVAAHGVNVSVRGGDLFDEIDPAERFQNIFWAHPFNNSSHPVDDMLIRSGFDYRYEGLTSYLNGAGYWLSPGGRLLLGTGDSADLESIRRIAVANSYTIRIVAEGSQPLEEGGNLLVRYLIYEFIADTRVDGGTELERGVQKI